MDLGTFLLAPVRVPLRLARALDDLASIADRARREPDPVDEVRERLDLAMAELALLTAVVRDLLEVARRIVTGGEDLTATGDRVAAVGRAIHLGGEDLTAVAERLSQQTAELVDGGQDLTATSQRIEADLQTFLAALPRLLAALDTVEDLEDAAGTVADAVEPLQGAAERVGRVTDRFSRRRG